LWYAPGGEFKVVGGEALRNKVRVKNAIREKLLHLSAATVDRLLKPERKKF